ncbi:MAG TPA: IPT/TIG domain-containing protein, partial [Terracidiphilus sp.]
MPKAKWSLCIAIMWALTLGVWARATNLPFGQVVSGNIASTAQANSFTFTGAVGDVVDFTMTTTNGNLNPKIRLYNPDGTLNKSASNYYANGGCYPSTSVEMNTITLPAAGTYTLLAGDCGDTNTGTYDLYAQSTKKPTGAATLVLNVVSSGNIASAALSNTFTFSGKTNDVVDFTVATAGFDPRIRLYNPDGTLNQSTSNYYANGTCYPSASVEMNTVTLPATGTYTVLIADCGNTSTGTYNLYAQSTRTPLSATNLLWGELQTGNVASSAQSTTFKFTGAANDMVSFTLATGSFDPKIRLYNPDGTLNHSASNYYANGACFPSSTVEMNSVKLPAAGTYTVLIGDCGDQATGTVTLSTQCFGVCQLAAPVISSISPTSVLFGRAGFPLTVKGSNFVSVNVQSVAQWNGTDLPTTFVSTGQLTAAVPSTDVVAGCVPINVFTPSSGGGSVANTSNSVQFCVDNPVPGLTSLSPASTIAGGAAFTLTLNGARFVPGTSVSWNGNALTTTYVSATQVTASVPAADIALAGTATVAVTNATPGGGVASLPFTIDNPVPVLTSISPAAKTAGAATFTLTATGAGFVNTSAVLWNGTALPTTYVSASQVTASVGAPAIACGAAVPITVSNSTPGGGISLSKTLTVNNPSPVASSISPTSAAAGGAQFTLTVTGSKFVSCSVIEWNGAGLTTTFVNSTKLTAVVPASDLQNPGTASVTVFSPTPSGGTSSPAVPFTIGSYPVPTTTSIQPTSAIAGASGFTLTVNGTNFVQVSAVDWNGSALSTTFVSSSKLTAVVPQTDIATAGTAKLTVVNPSPGGGTSTPPLTFTVNNPVPSVSSMSPASTPALGPGFTLTVNGSNFVSKSKVLWNGTALTTTYVSTTQVTAAVPTSGIAVPGTASVTVSNPTPGGGTASPALTFTIGNSQAATPVIAPDAGSYGAGQMISITDGTTNASIYYTTGGTLPTTSSAKYTKPFVIASSLTVQA